MLPLTLFTLSKKNWEDLDEESAERSSALTALLLKKKTRRTRVKIQGYASLVVPNVVGCVDGSHISIPGPVKDNSYYNRKGFHSILLQAICDADLKFIDVFFGFPGSVHDAKVWAESDIGKALKDGTLNLKHGRLLGDSAYPLQSYLMTPYRDNGHLTKEQTSFNKTLSSSRILIEQAFGMLKNKFRRLKYFYITKLQNMKYHIIAACVLHNVHIQYLLDNDIFEPLDDIEIEDEDEYAPITSDDVFAKCIRDNLCQELASKNYEL